MYTSKRNLKISKTRRYVLTHNAPNIILNQVDQAIKALRPQEQRPHERPTILAVFHFISFYPLANILIKFV